MFTAIDRCGVCVRLDPLDAQPKWIQVLTVGAGGGVSASVVVQLRIVASVLGLDGDIEANAINVGHVDGSLRPSNLSPVTGPKLRERNRGNRTVTTIIQVRIGRSSFSSVEVRLPAVARVIRQ